MPAELLTERRDNTLLLTLSDPGSQQPLLSHQVFTAGIELLNVAESDPGVRSVVLRGEAGHFCGHDANLPLWTDSAEARADMQHLFDDFAEALRVFPKPVIAAVEGIASGDGFWLALACDLIVAAEDARFVPFPASQDPGQLRFAARLGNAVPRSRLLQWLWGAESVDAAQMNQLGLVNWMSRPGEATTQALQVAERFAPLSLEAVAKAKEWANLQG